MLKKALKFNSSRYRLHEENAAFARSLKPNSIVLDAGCGESPYRDLFKDMQYESADFAQVDKPYAQKITYVCNLKAIPVESNRFDHVILNQVLEHIPEPTEVLAELYRVLKPGGTMLCTAPLFYQEHEQPYDFYRYTQFGWRYQIEKAGFTVERIDCLEGVFGLYGYFFEIMYYNLPMKSAAIGGKTGRVAAPALKIIHPLLGWLAVLFHRLEKHAKVTTGTGPKNYTVVVKKPSKRKAGS